jgi:hypothetical protein
MKVALFTLTLLLFHFVQGQSFRWARQVQLSVAALGAKVLVDSEKNILVMGNYGSGQTRVNTNTGDFLMKYDPNGKLLWMNRVKGSVVFHDISLDKYDNVYVSGVYWKDTIDFNIVQLYPPDPGHPERDIFIAKYDKNGNCLWARNTGLAQSGYFRLVADKDGNLYGCAMVTRYNMNLTGKCLMDPNGNLEVFKWDANGNCVWKSSVQVTAIEPNYITVDKQGNIYFGGTTYFKAAFDNYTIPEWVQFIARYNSSGKCEWVKYFKWIGQVGLASCAVDENSNVYVAGFADSFIFEGKTYYSYGATSPQNSSLDALVVKFDQKGNTKWVKQYGRKGQETAFDISVDNVGNLFVCGYYDKNTTLGSYSLNSGFRSPYVMKLDSAGEVKWVTEPSFPDSASGALAYGLHNDRKGNIYVTGQFRGKLQFGDSLVYAANHEMFLAQIGDLQHIPTSVKAHSPTSLPLLYPNPGSGRFRIEIPGADFHLQDVIVRNVMGAEVLRMGSLSFTDLEIDMSDKPRGIYFVEVAGREGRVTMKIVLQ